MLAATIPKGEKKILFAEVVNVGLDFGAQVRKARIVQSDKMPQPELMDTEATDRANGEKRNALSAENPHISIHEYLTEYDGVKCGIRPQQSAFH